MRRLATRKVLAGVVCMASEFRRIFQYLQRKFELNQKIGIKKPYNLHRAYLNR